ncbi:MAG: hypothetical protein K2K75_01460 [Muribaculaceae bacterium]|nr:hypothetical protein [Muribaculaceae bacterium]
MSEGSKQLELDISSLPKGIHFFNCRFGNGYGEWGSVYRRMMLTIAKNVGVSSYEYWIDNNYGEKVSGSLISGVNSYDIDFDGLQKGLHKFSYRLMTEEGVWGAPFTKYYFKIENKSNFTRYEYWLDNDYESRVSADVTSESVMLEVDLSGFNKSSGKHYFNLRSHNSDGEWSTVYRKLLVFQDPNHRVPIIGYSHYVNGIDLGYVDMEPTDNENIHFDVLLPDRKLLQNSLESDEEEISGTDSVRYVLHLKSQAGWLRPVFWDLNLDKLISKSVRISYDGRYIVMTSDEDGGEIRYSISDNENIAEGVYTESFDANGLCHITAWTERQGYLDSEKSEYEVRYYSDEEHAETSTGGLLESSFEWSGSDWPQSVESFRVEGVLDETDYKFLNSMRSLRHLDIENVAAASIPAKAFLDSKLISISLPEDLAEYGDSIISGATCLSSVIWNSKTQDPEGRLTDVLENPNVILYMPSDINVANPRDLNIVTEGRATDVKLHYGHPYYAAREFHTDNVSMTKEFIQETEIGVCRGWETIVLPFKPRSIVHAVNGPAVP